MTTNRTVLEQESTLSNADLNAIISAADEVITAIAGENEEVHPDNSTKMCALWDDLNDRHAPPAVVKALANELLAYRKASKEPMMYTVTFEGQIEEIGGDCQSFKREDCQQYIEWLCDEDNQEGYEVVPLFSAPQIQAVAVPDGYALVPIEPTEDMVIEGFESEPDKFFSEEEEWEKFETMSGCEQAAHKAKLCWTAMIAAAPKSITNEP